MNYPYFGGNITSTNFKFIMNLNNKISIDLKPYLQSTSQTVSETNSKPNNEFVFIFSKNFI